MKRDLEFLLLEIIHAQKVFVKTFARALHAEGVTTIDALTRHMEEISAVPEHPSNHLVEQMVDALRDEFAGDQTGEPSP